MKFMGELLLATLGSQDMLYDKRTLLQAKDDKRHWSLHQAMLYLSPCQKSSATSRSLLLTSSSWNPL